MARYTIGVDFGTLSGRAVLADTASGRVLREAAMDYSHGVIDRALPSGRQLPLGWALQDPQDYTDVLSFVLHEVTKDIEPSQIAGIGVDVTTATCLPLGADGVPLCLTDKFRGDPYAWTMMWKHHGCLAQAAKLERTAVERGEPWLPYYGGHVNAEWTFPKLLQICEEAPDVYAAADTYVEVTDWLASLLTGRLVRSASCLGFKAFYRNGRFPDRAYFEAVDPAFADAADKLRGPILPVGASFGTVTAEAAERFGIPEGIPVAGGLMDAHVCLPGAGITGTGKMLDIVGTSSCHIMLADRAVPVEGICGEVSDGVVPGCVGYEAGQSGVGDCFRWFEKNCVSGDVTEEAKARGLSVQGLLTEKAKLLKPGESGLIALDWWNGNRSILTDAGLSGMLLGMTLQTRPEEIYRALIEATAYGARVIMDNYRDSGVHIGSFFASGGVALKNPMAMQIYADVLRMPVQVCEARQGPALGSAIMAAAASGVHSSVEAATIAMGSPVVAVYEPDENASAVYEQLYREYRTLYDLFGRGGNDVLHRLRDLAAANRSHEE